MMTVEQRLHARIMWEGGCSMEDICMVFNVCWREALEALAPMSKKSRKLEAMLREYLGVSRVPRYPQGTNNTQAGRIAA